MAVSKDTIAAPKPVDAELGKRARIPAATDIAPSGAPQQTTDIDLDHVAIDNDPRAGTTELSNRADFNDPTATGPDQVAEMLNRQGVPTKTGAEAAESVKAGR